MNEPQGSTNSIGGTPAEASDVPVSTNESMGGVIGSNEANYKKGGEVKTCSMTSHEKNKSSPNW